MYKATLDQAQEFINILQGYPYKEVYQLVAAITQSQKDKENNYLFDIRLYQALKSYLENKPFSSVYSHITLLTSLPQVENNVQSELPEGYSEESVGK